MSAFKKDKKRALGTGGITGDILEECLPSTFIRVVLSVGEIQLGKSLLRLDWEKAAYRFILAIYF